MERRSPLAGLRSGSLNANTPEPPGGSVAPPAMNGCSLRSPPRGLRRSRSLRSPARGLPRSRLRWRFLQPPSGPPAGRGSPLFRGFTPPPRGVRRRLPSAADPPYPPSSVGYPPLKGGWNKESTPLPPKGGTAPRPPSGRPPPKGGLQKGLFINPILIPPVFLGCRHVKNH